MDDARFEVSSHPVRPLGGQQAGSVPMAIMVKHKATGTTAICSHERSQHKNRNAAFNMVKWGLHVLEWPLDSEPQPVTPTKE